MRKTVTDFLDFMRGRGVVGFAVGFILGRAVSDLVGSFVNDILNPVIGLATGGLTALSEKHFMILSASVNYGKFLNLVINFIVLSMVVYFGIKILRLEKLDKQK